MKLNLSNLAKSSLRKSRIGRFWLDYHEKWSEKDRVKWRYEKMRKERPDECKKQLWRRAHRLYDVELPEPAAAKPQARKYNRDEYQKLVYLCPMSTVGEIAKFWNEMGLRSREGGVYNKKSVDQIIRRLGLHYPRRELNLEAKKIVIKMIDTGHSNSEIASFLDAHKYPPRAVKKWHLKTIQAMRKKHGQT